MATTLRETSLSKSNPEISGRLDSLIVKVAERCNLKCSYCYMYEHEDKSYLKRPKFMDETIFNLVLLRAKEYCDRRPNHKLFLTFHGGEPTLLGPTRFLRYIIKAREFLGNRLGGISMQTNGTLIDDEWIAILKKYHIPVSISLDGPALAHDANRVDFMGNGSHSSTVRGFRLLQKAGLKPGILCVIDPRASGLENYRYFRSLGATHINFLLPDATWESKDKLYGELGVTPIADYLIPVFDKWFGEDDPSVQIRILLGLLSKMMGGDQNSDSFGNPLMSYLIVETDGSIQALDALRVCEEGIADSGLNVATHGFDNLAQGLPLVHRVVHEGIPLCDTCRACPEVNLCGGGYLPHRYSKGNGFNNPSIWCLDILKIIGHMRNRTGLMS